MCMLNVVHVWCVCSMLFMCDVCAQCCSCVMCMLNVMHGVIWSLFCVCVCAVHSVSNDATELHGLYLMQNTNCSIIAGKISRLLKCHHPKSPATLLFRPLFLTTYKLMKCTMPSWCRSSSSFHWIIFLPFLAHFVTVYVSFGLRISQYMRIYRINTFLASHSDSVSDTYKLYWHHICARISGARLG